MTNAVLSSTTSPPHLPPDPRNSPVLRSGSSLLLDGQPWKAVGPNVYWLGLDENVTPRAGEPFYPPLRASYPAPGRIVEIMGVVRAMGGTMIRSHTLGVSVGNPLSVMPKPGVVNQEAFKAIDYAIYQARMHGLRLLVPLTDNYEYYHGGKYTFLQWAGYNLTQAQHRNDPLIQQFYTNQTIIDNFKNYIRILLAHVNPHTNLSYAQDPTIFAFETGNEMFGPKWGDMDVPATWVKDIAIYVKSLAPEKLFVDGTYGVNETHLGIDEVDIFSNHYYPARVSKLQRDLGLVGAVNKVYFVGEYDWLGTSAADADSLEDFFAVIENSPVAGGDQFWSLFGRNVPECNKFVEHADGFTMHYGNPQNSADINSRIRAIRRHFWKMSSGVDIEPNALLPEVPCPRISGKRAFHGPVPKARLA